MGGSFSISVQLLDALKDEFSTELTAKAGKFDTDPHWWMPMTLNEETYSKIMESKGEGETCAAHYARMAAFKSNFLSNVQGSKLSNEHILGGVGIGQDCYWWDYGQLKMWQRTCCLQPKASTVTILQKQRHTATSSRFSKALSRRQKPIILISTKSR